MTTYNNQEKEKIKRISGMEMLTIPNHLMKYILRCGADAIYYENKDNHI